MQRLYRIPFWVFALLVAALGAVLFSPGLGGSFVLDDAQTIVNNPLVHIETLDRESILNASVGYIAGGGARPLPMASFGIDYWRHGGLDARTFKGTNLFIHGLTAFFLALFLRRLLLLAQWAPRRASIGALILVLAWAAHPLQVSSVLYVVQRMQTMATLFLVLALWSYLALRQAQIEGRRAWPQGALTVGFWGFALLSKEDAVMLPFYALALELGVLRFRAADPARARDLRHGFLLLGTVAALAFFFWAVPRYWTMGPYSGRDFNSLERLLTQARVLVMYLGQIVIPLPGRMPFNYDTLAVSRGLLQPPGTLFSLLFLGGLCAWAWLWRRRHPLFFTGVLLFFLGHFVTSNVVGIELAFEHRNHFALIGALLALLGLATAIVQQARLSPRSVALAVSVTLLALASAGTMRAYQWGEPVRFARYSVNVNPDSPRAWLALGGTYFDLAGRRNARGSPLLDLAIEAVEQGAKRTGAPSAYSNAVIYKTIQGTITPTDWERLLRRMDEAEMTPATRNILWTTLANVRAEIGLDEGRALELIALTARRSSMSAPESLQVGVRIYHHFADKDAALPYFLAAAEGLPSGDPAMQDVQRLLIKDDRGAWAAAIEEVGLSKAVTPAP